MLLVLALDFDAGGLRNCSSMAGDRVWRWRLYSVSAPLMSTFVPSHRSVGLLSGATLRWIYFHVYFTVCWSKTFPSSICFPHQQDMKPRILFTSTYFHNQVFTQRWTRDSWSNWNSWWDPEWTGGVIYPSSRRSWEVLLGRRMGVGEYPHPACCHQIPDKCKIMAGWMSF